MSRYGDHFTESADYKRTRKRHAGELRARPDWPEIEQYARLCASERVIRVLNALQGDVATWAADDSRIQITTAAEVFEDFRDRVIDLLRLEEAEPHVKATTT